VRIQREGDEWKGRKGQEKEGGTEQRNRCRGKEDRKKPREKGLRGKIK